MQYKYLIFFLAFLTVFNELFKIVKGDKHMD